MDILFETPASSSQDLAGALISRCELGMSKAILGGTLTSQSDGAASTNALGRVHDRVRRDLTISDAMQIASTLSRQLLAPLAVLNCGVSDPAPAAVVPVRYAGGRGHRHVRTGAPGAGLGDEDFGSLGARQAQDPGSRKRKRYIGGLEGVTPSLP